MVFIQGKQLCVYLDRYIYKQIWGSSINLDFYMRMFFFFDCIVNKYYLDSLFFLYIFLVIKLVVLKFCD